MGNLRNSFRLGKCVLRACVRMKVWVRVCAFTEHSRHESKWEMWGKGSEEPRSGVQTGADLVLLQMSVQLSVIVVQQTRQLIHLNLRKREHTRQKSASPIIMDKEFWYTVEYIKQIWNISLIWWTLKKCDGYLWCFYWASLTVIWSNSSYMVSCGICLFFLGGGGGTCIWAVKVDILCD